MEMHQVRYFLAVSRTLNFTKAAEECNVAQPSLTRAVQKLEDELGGPLFHRERANTHLTELGRLMLPHLDQTYNAAQAAKSLATSIRKGEIAPLRLAVSGTVSTDLFMDTFSGLQKTVKGLQLALGSGSRSAVIASMLDGDFDLVVAEETDDLPERLRSWPLFREPCHVVVPQAHRFANLEAVPIAELATEPLVERLDCPLAPAFLALCAEAGIEAKVGHRATSEEQLQKLVLAGFGYSIAPCTVALASGLVGVPFEGQVLERAVMLATVAGRRFSPAADAFIKVARVKEWKLERSES
jgi:DNA-binding transcriptional LysR family regulator